MAQEPAVAETEETASEEALSPSDAGDALRDIERLIKEALPDAQVEIRDLAGDGDHYAAHVVSAEFKGKSRVQQHQMVYGVLGDLMQGEVHALALRTLTPQQWKKQIQ